MCTRYVQIRVLCIAFGGSHIPHSRQLSVVAVSERATLVGGDIDCDSTDEDDRDEEDGGDDDGANRDGCGGEETGDDSMSMFSTSHSSVEMDFLLKLCAITQADLCYCNL